MKRKILKKIINILLLTCILMFCIQPKLIYGATTHTHEPRSQNGIVYDYYCTQTKGSPACTAAYAAFCANPSKYGVKQTKETSQQSSQQSSQQGIARPTIDTTKIKNTHYHTIKDGDGYCYKYKCTEVIDSSSCNAKFKLFSSNPEQYGIYISGSEYLELENDENGPKRQTLEIQSGKDTVENKENTQNKENTENKGNNKDTSSNNNTNSHTHTYTDDDGNEYKYTCTQPQGSSGCTAATSAFRGNPSKYGTLTKKGNTQNNNTQEKNYGTIQTTETGKNNIEISEKNITLTESQMTQYVHRLYTVVLNRESNALGDSKVWIERWNNGMSVQEVTKGIILSTESVNENPEIKDASQFCPTVFEWITGFKCGTETKEALTNYYKTSANRFGVIKLICNSTEFLNQFTSEDSENNNTISKEGSINYIASKDKLQKIGDLSGNGYVGIEDATIVLSYYAQSLAGYDVSKYDYAKDYLDANGDGKVRADDAEIILSYYSSSAASLINRDECDVREFAKQKMEENQ